MESNKEQSIYCDLKKFYKENKSQVYIYQDLDTTGKKEYEVIVERSYELKEYEKNRLSNKLIQIIIKTLKDQKELNELNKFIEDNPVILYYENYIRLLKSHLNYSGELKKDFDEFIKKIMIESSCEEEVKLGIISSSLSNIDNLSQILDVFSIHNNYIFYVIKCLNYLGDNNKIFDICKNSYGYGKVFCVMNLSCVNKEMRNWLFEKGCINNVGISELIEYCFLGGDLLKYFEENEYDEEKFENVIMHFNELISDYDLYELENGIEICLNIIEIIESNFGGVNSLYAIVLIMDSIESCHLSDTKIEDKYIEVMYNNILSKCKDICSKKEWHTIIEHEFDNIDNDDTILISCAEKLKYKVKKKEFQRLFNRNYKSPNLYKYAVTLGSSAIKKFLFYDGIKKLNINNLLTGADDIKLEDVSYDNIEQVCLFIVVNYLKYEEYSDIYKQINLHALKCPIVETRCKAIINLKTIKELLDENDKNFIKELIEHEMIQEIRKSLMTFLPKNDEKSIRYVNINKELKIQPHVKDIYLNTTQIAEINYYNMSVVIDKLFEEDLIYLQREPNNFYDENDILVITNEGYVLGHISKKENTILKNLMDNGKYIYGYIKSINEDYSDIQIDLYLSYEDILEEIANTLALLTDDYNEYLQ